jgi:hypothetical protein
VALWKPFMADFGVLLVVSRFWVFALSIRGWRYRAEVPILCPWPQGEHSGGVELWWMTQVLA